jgi:hypothetical protein
MPRPVKDMLTTDLITERQLLKEMTFPFRYGTSFDLKTMKSVPLKLGEYEKALIDRFEELSEELLKRQEEERKRWKRSD